MLGNDVEMPPHAKFATLVLRAGLGAVFVWYGIDKTIHPEIWGGWVPAMVKSVLPVSVALFLKAQGVAEITAGVLLLLGKFTRLAALTTALFLASILIFIGPNDVTVRDIGLLGAALSLFLTGSDFFSLDRTKRR
jgi:uncharacterized membrane protein YphA (DoxX/SURF4 family)